MKIKFIILLLACLSLAPPAQCGGNTEIEDPEAKQAAIYTEKGDSAFEQGSYAEAIENYTIAIKLKPDMADAYFGRGRAYYYDSRAIRASDDFSTAIELGREDADVYYYRGWARIAENGFELAANDFTQALTLDPGMAQAYYARAWTEVNMAQWSQSSILYLYQKFEADSGLPIAYMGEGWKWIRQEQWELAAAPDLMEAVELEPDMAAVYINIGFAHFKQAEWTRAIANFDAALARDPTLNRGPFPRESAVEQRSRWDIVIEDYDKVVQILVGGSSTEGISNASATGNQDYDLAVAYYNRAKELAQNQELKQIAQAALDLMKEWYEEMASNG